MNKKGFTLAELIVTLGIIGIIASISAPILSNLIPDKRKTTVLKVYKLANEVTKELLNDISIYPDEYNGSEASKCTGLSCKGKPIAPPYDKVEYEGDGKYIHLLADKLAAIKTNLTTGNANGNFTTKDNLLWTLEADNSDYKLIIDLNDNKETNNCTYNSSSCKKPGQFEFKILENGKVRPIDPLTRAYIENPHKLNDIKEDFERAKEIESEISENND